ncbi:hypothetical protein HPB47_024406 [Ixodes persulcatus]|uniref:Uncharacterized protein n=1 Tax=Ixodes persulcatus TaxID=34615 RepID=A0AC60Q4T9_IXOPE|nr:hypothetical protein HPB47_024406 [Ixodes persulcatus]
MGATSRCHTAKTPNRKPNPLAEGLWNARNRSDPRAPNDRSVAAYIRDLSTLAARRCLIPLPLSSMGRLFHRLVAGMCPWVYASLALALPVSLLVLHRLWGVYRVRRVSLRHKHFFITGGSSGIGRALASQVVRRGANVTLLARDRTRLEEARLELQDQTAFPDQVVHTVSADLSQDSSALAGQVQEAEEACGPVDFLVNCAGSATSLRFEETPAAEFRRMMELNYLSAVHATKAVLPGMRQRGHGAIVLVSSIAGVFGVYGFSAYAASKFALVGLAQALCMEVRHRGVSVTVAFPPDTDTPGFAEEQRTKPVETKLICASGGLHSPETVARSILDDALRGHFVSVLGLDGMVMLNMCAGMMPPSSLLDLVVQVACMGALRLVGACYLTHFYRLVARQATLRQQAKKPL